MARRSAPSLDRPNRDRSTASSFQIVGGVVRASRPYILPLLAATFFALVGLVFFQRLERYLTQSDRFVMRPSELGAHQSPDLAISGVVRSNQRELLAIFAQDEGKSVFQIPLDDRRERIEKLQWVRTAAVSRLWPNQIGVVVTERTPIAFVQLPPERRGHATRPKLIDADGELLQIPAQFSGTLPVLTGIREDQTKKDRAARVGLMQRLLAELGPLAKPISEIDVRDAENPKVVYPTDSHAVTLLLGNEQWRARVEKFIRHYPEIRRKMPNAIELDLRLRDRITATEVDKDKDGQ